MKTMDDILSTLDSKDEDLYKRKYVEDVNYLLDIIYDRQEFIEKIQDQINDLLSLSMPSHMKYDPSYGDDIKCVCGHAYYRHFDTYENMAPVGCKYCYHADKHGPNCCPRFKKASEK